MNEETEPSEEQVEDKAEGQPETHQDPLEEVYQEFNVDEAAQQFKAQPEQNVQQTDPYLDYDETQTNALVGQVNDALSRVTQTEQRLEKQVMEADISKAVEHISKQIEGVDQAVIRAHLNAQADTDPKFMNLWDNRQANPKAWEKGVDAMGRKMAGIFSVKQDPQLTENQRAAKQSQQSMAATNTTQSDDWGDLSEDEIDKRVSAIKADGY